MKKHFFLFGILLIANISFGQSMHDFVSSGLNENDISKKLPPLDSLLSYAKENSPRLKFYDADYEYWDGVKKLEKRAWMDNVSFDANYGYGVYDNLSSQFVADNPTSSQAFFTTEQDRYLVGVSVKMPLSSILNRNRAVKNAKAEADKSKYQKDFAIKELELLIMKQYNDLIKAHRLFFISGSIVETYKVQSVRAEKDFTNGVINVTEYTRLQQMLNEAIKSLETQKSEFLYAFMSLENMVGVELKI